MIYAMIGYVNGFASACQLREATLCFTCCQWLAGATQLQQLASDKVNITGASFSLPGQHVLAAMTFPGTHTATDSA